MFDHSLDIAWCHLSYSLRYGTFLSGTKSTVILYNVICDGLYFGDRNTIPDIANDKVRSVCLLLGWSFLVILMLSLRDWR